MADGKSMATNQALVQALLGHMPERCTKVVLTLEVGNLPTVVVTQHIDGEAVERLLQLSLQAQPAPKSEAEMSALPVNAVAAYHSTVRCPAEQVPKLFAMPDLAQARSTARSAGSAEHPEAAASDAAGGKGTA